MADTLNSYSFDIGYRTDQGNFDQEFLIPAYRRSVLLERGSGFFTLRSLIRSFDGLIDFANNNGIIHLVCSPRLSETDIRLIAASLSDSFVSDKIREVVTANEEDVDLSKLDVICNMINEDKLIIKIAYMPDGVYHEKFGIFSDESGNMVSFNGSNNETEGAKYKNFESFEVFTSWEGGKDLKRISNHKSHFNDLWQNNCPGVSVMTFPEAAQKALFEAYKTSPSLEESISKYLANRSSIKKKQLYSYQSTAINEFVANGYKHFYEMATGTGKTFTSVNTIVRLEQELGEKLFVIICVPQTDLQLQWKKEILSAGYSSVYTMGGETTGRRTTTAIDMALLSYINRRKNDTVVCIATYDAFFDRLSKEINRLKNVFVIVDEAHNLTCSNVDTLKLLGIKYRLGLSATLLRYSKDETESIEQYFTGGIRSPFKYTIEEAIANGFLSHYKYYPIPVEMTGDEFSSYQRMTNALAIECSKEKKLQDKKRIDDLCQARARIVKKAELKITLLKELLSIPERYSFRNAVVYCGMGLSTEENDGVADSIINLVTRSLYDAGLKVQQFTSQTEDRPAVLKAFERGEYDTLAAIKCFDEGVDMPKLDKIYIMASDNSLRQTVQRRGRVLRQCKETNKTMAYIYDMIVSPPVQTKESGVVALIANEFRRAQEYNRLADNANENFSFFDIIKRKYNISDSELGNETDPD